MKLAIVVAVLMAGGTAWALDDFVQASTEAEFIERACVSERAAVDRRLAYTVRDAEQCPGKARAVWQKRIARKQELAPQQAADRTRREDEGKALRDAQQNEAAAFTEKVNAKFAAEVAEAAEGERLASGPASLWLIFGAALRIDREVRASALKAIAT